MRSNPVGLFFIKILFAATPAIAVVTAVMIGSQLTACSQPVHRNWDFSEVRKTYIPSDKQPFGGLAFVPFVYYEGNRSSVQTQYMGFEILQNGKTSHIEMDNYPNEHGSTWSPVTGVSLNGLVDLDGDGNEDLAISAYNHTAGGLRVFSDKPKAELIGSMDGEPFLYSLVSVDEGEEKPKVKIFGTSFGAPPERTVIVNLKDGKLVAEPYARSTWEEDFLGWGRRSAVSWRTGDSFGWQEQIDQSTYYLKSKPNDSKLLAVRAALKAGSLTFLQDGAKAVRVDAIADANKALSIDEHNALAHAVLGHLLDGDGRSAEAVQQLNKAVAEQPKMPEWYAHRGLAFEGMRKNDEAIKDYTQEIALDPQSDWAYASRAHAKFESGDMPGAIVDADAALKLNDKNVFALKQRSRAYGNSGNDAKALPDFEAIAQMQPTDPDNLVVLGICYQRLGKRDKAKQTFQAVLKMDPSNQAALDGLAHL